MDGRVLCFWNQAAQLYGSFRLWRRLIATSLHWNWWVKNNYLRQVRYVNVHHWASHRWFDLGQQGILGVNFIRASWFWVCEKADIEAVRKPQANRQNSQEDNFNFFQFAQRKVSLLFILGASVMVQGPHIRNDLIPGAKPRTYSGQREQENHSWRYEYWKVQFGIWGKWKNCHDWAWFHLFGRYYQELQLVDHGFFGVHEKWADWEKDW